jgi:hypothetical protein
MSLPQGPEAIDDAARILALDVPDACRDGIAQNLSLLRTHALIVAAALADGDPEA